MNCGSYLIGATFVYSVTYVFKRPASMREAIPPDPHFLFTIASQP